MIQESLNEQKTSINNLQASFEERFDRLEDQFSTFTQSLEEPHETQSMSMRKDFHLSSHSLNE